MARQIAWTEAAWADLESATGFIAKDSPVYAATFIREIVEAADSLVELAERGRLVPEFMNPGVRELILGSYRLIYEVSEQNMHILGLVHGPRDLPALWSDEERGGT